MDGHEHLENYPSEKLLFAEELLEEWVAFLRQAEEVGTKVTSFCGSPDKAGEMLADLYMLSSAFLYCAGWLICLNGCLYCFWSHPAFWYVFPVVCVQDTGT